MISLLNYGISRVETVDQPITLEQVSLALLLIVLVRPRDRVR
jgi:hypothetical protein